MAAPTTFTPYSSDPPQVLASLDASQDGLASDQAQARLDRDGPNSLPSPQRPSLISRILVQFDNVLIYILLVAAVVKALMGDWVDFSVILAVAVVNAAVGFVQEGQAARALEGIRNMLSTIAHVRRDGAWNEVDAAQLVVGDIVRVYAGDRVPADLRILESTNLQVDEAALTGESVPAQKDVAAVGSDAGVGDRASMLYSSTIVATGTGTGVVTATGRNTEIGRIQQLVADADPLDTPLSRQLAKFGKYLSIAILGTAALMLLIGRVLHDFALPELLSAAIGFAVAAVPEGLPALVTVTLALGVQQMARRRAITRKLTSVETLGSVTTICSDKTGTLTTNEMLARTVVTAEATYAVEGHGYMPEGQVLLDGKPVTLAERSDLKQLMLAASACLDATVVQRDGQWHIIGEPTEGAVAVLAAKTGADQVSFERRSELPFDSATKYLATLDHSAEYGTFVRATGAPDRLLSRSTHELAPDGSIVPIDRAKWEKAIEDLAAQGLRTLATVERRVDSDTESLTHADVHGMVFLGVFGIVDPPRPEAIDAIAICHRAGIKVKMITGDHVGTATAIARELGIAPAKGEVKSLTGAELEEMSQEDLRQRVKGIDVFARTSPEHKIRIVRALQSHGEVVAMTGDGVNDAPALTRADVGVAMGIKGTEATKEAADIVLTDDNFASIENAVEEGRRIYDNIRKSVIFLLPTNGAQSLVILVAIVLGFALPLTPVQILWVNLITSVTLSLALAYEKAEPGLMERKPRGNGGAVLSRRSFVHVIVASLLIGGATLAVYFLQLRSGTSEGIAQTSAITMLVLGQLAYLFNCRFLTRSSLTLKVFTGNKAIWISIGALMALQLLFTYAPFMQAWFNSTSIGLGEWALAIVFALGIFLAVEAMKYVDRNVVLRR